MPAPNDPSSSESFYGLKARAPENLGRSMKKSASKIRRFFPVSNMRSAVIFILIVVTLISLWQATYTVPSDSIAVVQRF